MLPAGSGIIFSWPTRRRDIFSNLSDYIARTRANPLYGKPGWTRECGQRFHRGCDIAPIAVTPTGQTCTVMFTNCDTGSEYPSEEPVVLPDDDVFVVYQGKVAGINKDIEESEFGIHVIIEHVWPDSGHVFYSLYAHLDNCEVEFNEHITSGVRIGRMGQTSNSVMGRQFLSIAPHLHIEFWNHAGQSFDPLEMLMRYLPKTG